MSTEIQWTDETWNPVTGCSKVSPGCAHCYAEGVAKRFWPTQYPRVPIATAADLDKTATFDRPREFTDVMCHEDRLAEPLSWRKPRKVFVNSMSDLFHEDVPDDFIDRVFAVMAWTPWHTYQILTKRAGRMREYFAAPWYRRVVSIYVAMRESTPRRKLIALDDARQRAQGWAFGSITCGEHARRFLPNVWLGVSVENQKFADERIPLLLQTPAAIRFISAEPLLGPVHLRWLPAWRNGSRATCLNPSARHTDHLDGLRRLDWVIVGGESGADARPCALEWIEAIVEQCKAAGVACFVKQLGAYVVSEERTMPSTDVFDPAKLTQEMFSKTYPDEVWAWRAGLNDRKGGDPDEWPDELRVREFPREVAHAV